MTTTNNLPFWESYYNSDLLEKTDKVSQLALFREYKELMMDKYNFSDDIADTLLSTQFISLFDDLIEYMETRGEPNESNAKGKVNQSYF